LLKLLRFSIMTVNSNAIAHRKVIISEVLSVAYLSTYTTIMSKKKKRTTTVRLYNISFFMTGLFLTNDKHLILLPSL